MGFRASWIAQRRGEQTDLLTLSGFERTGETSEWLDIGFYLLALEPNEVRAHAWTMLLALGSRSYGELQGRRDWATELSTGGEDVLHFWCTDTSMFAELSCYQRGEAMWTLTVDPNLRARVEGTLPAAADEILKRCEEEQLRAGKDVDFVYDAPAQIGDALLGFRHDRDPVTEQPEPFQVLSAAGR